MQFDVGWYASIVRQGYIYSNVPEDNCAFFPLFPLIWKLMIRHTGSIWAVCIYNAFAFITGMYILKRAFRFSWAYFLLFLSLPSNMFMFVPYTESTFFLFSSILLAGIQCDNKYLVILGLLLTSVTRPVTFFFVPIILISELLSYRDFGSFIRRSLLYLTVPVSGIIAVFIYQLESTGVWLAFFKVQSRLFHHQFSWPVFPLNTWGGARILWIDAFAIFFALAAGLALLIVIIRRIKKGNVDGNVPDRAFVFSMAYLAICGLYILFSNGVDGGGGTTLVSANRYIIATPYFAIFLLFCNRHASTDKVFRISFFLMLALSFISFRTFGPWFSQYSELVKFIYRLFFAINIFMHVAFNTNFGKRLIPLIYMLNMVLQVVLLQQFASGEWVG